MIKIDKMKGVIVYATILINTLVILGCNNSNQNIEAQADTTSVINYIEQPKDSVVPVSQKQLCNYITKKNFDKWYEDQLGRSPFDSYEIENVIFEGTITKSEGILGTYEINYIYYPDINNKECKHVLTFVLFDLYKMYSEDQLREIIGQKVAVYAPKIKYAPFKTADFTNCGLWATVEVYRGWNFVNKDDFDLVEPKKNEYFLNYNF